MSTPRAESCACRQIAARQMAEAVLQRGEAEVQSLRRCACRERRAGGEPPRQSACSRHDP